MADIPVNADLLSSTAERLEALVSQLRDVGARFNAQCPAGFVLTKAPDVAEAIRVLYKFVARIDQVCVGAEIRGQFGEAASDRRRRNIQQRRSG